MTNPSDRDTVLDRIRGSANELLDRISDAVRDRARELDEVLGDLARSYASPENLDRFQSTMATMTRLLYRMGFSVDPGARRLFEFMDWSERNYGRQRVLEGLRRYNPLLRPDFADLVRSASRSVVGGNSSTSVSDVRSELEEFRESAALDVLQFLAHLAEPEADGPPPGRDADELGDYVLESDIPDRFRELVARARDTGPAATAESTRSEVADDREETTGSLARRVRGAIQKRVGLDRQLQFLSAGFLFASQGFLTRTALESLPELVRRSNLDDEDVIDL